MLLKKRYPFDTNLKHHFIIALGLAIWIFVFLYFTEPLDVNELTAREKLIYLPLYGGIGAIIYLFFIPLQYYLYKKNKQLWTITQELIFIVSLCLICIVFLRLFYLYIIVAGEPNPYSFSYHLNYIMLPAMATILPIIIFGRYAFGKYKDKKLEEQRIEIKGEGNYESIRLLFNELVCIQSSDNYVEVFYLSGTILKKSLIRTKLSVIAETFPELLRTHRSYIINPFHFKQWKTEKGKPFLLLSHAVEVPVSKTYASHVKTAINFATV